MRRFSTPLMNTQVVLLLLSRRPAAIFFEISLEIINAIKSFPKWSFSHILKEIRKSFPPITYENVLAPIFPIRFMVWIGAALNHRVPTRIGTTRFFIGRAMPMFKTFETSTRARPSTKQFMTRNNFLYPTITFAKPSGVRANFPGPRNNNKLFKSTANQVYGVLTSHRVMI